MSLTWYGAPQAAAPRQLICRLPVNQGETSA